MERSDPGLTTSTSEADISNQSRMKGSLSLILFGLIVLLAISAVRAEEEEANSLAEELAELRVARSPDARRKRKNRNKKGMKAKKAKKGRKGRKRNKKQRKGRKNQNNRLQKKKGRASTTLDDTCFESAMHYMKVWKDIVGNFEKQRKRMVKQNKTGGNKSGKKGLFAPAAHRLVDIGGGNKSNMSCGGQYGNKGAAQLQNLTDTLFACEISVNASCNPANIPQPNHTFIARCKELADNFDKEAGLCYDKTYGGKKTNSSDACYCWTHSNLNGNIDELKTCKANKEAAAITAALKNCTAAFGMCRKFEDDAHSALSACASDSGKLTKKAANLAANNASMTAAKEKMASLAASRSLGRNTGRADAAAASCTEIITISQTIVKITNQNPQSPKITTYAKKISTSTVTCSTASSTQLDAVNADTTTAAPAGRRDRIRQ